MHLSLEVSPLQLQGHFFRLQAIGQHIYAQFFAFPNGIHQHRSKSPSGLILHGFPVTVIVDGRPGNHRPAIIQLPRQTPHTIRAIPPMRFHAMTHALPLQDKSHIHQVLKLLRYRIIEGHRLFYQGISDGTLLMCVHHRRFQLIVFRRSKRTDGFHFREGLKPIFAHKPGNFRIQALERFLAIPGTPVVAVGYLPAFRSSPISLIRRTLQIESSRVQLFHLCRQKVAEKHIVSLQHLLIDFRCIFFFPAPITQAFINLIVATPHSQ